MTFREFIRRAHITDDPIGDFLLDARADRFLPDITSLDHLDAYLRRCGALHEARDAGHAVWQRYQRALKQLV